MTRILTFFVFSLFTCSLSAQFISESFAPSVLGSPHTIDCIVKDDGSLIFIGDYAAIDGVPAEGVVSLNADGTRNESFSLALEIIPVFVDSRYSSSRNSMIIEGHNEDLVIITNKTVLNPYIVDKNGALKTEVPFPVDVSSVPHVTKYGDGYAFAGNSIGGVITIFVTDSLGVLDDSFTPYAYSGSIQEMKEDGNGNILVAGYKTLDDSNFNLFRITPEGNLDDGFELLATDSFLRGIEILENNRVLVYGSFSQIGDVSYPYGLALLDTNGNLDASFSNTALESIASGTVHAAAIDPDSEILAIAVEDDNFQMKIIGVNLDGSPNENFETIAFDVSNISEPTIVFGAGKFLATSRTASTYEGSQLTFVVFDNTGEVDLTVSQAVELFSAGLVKTAVEFINGDLLIGGEFTHIGNTNTNGLALINRLGELDENFNANSPISAEDIVEKLVLAEDGSVYVGGFLKNKLNQIETPIIRLSPSGTLDENFIVEFSSSASSEFLRDMVLLDNQIIFSPSFREGIQAIDFNGDFIDGFESAVSPEFSVREMIKIDSERIAIAGQVLNGPGIIYIMNLDGALVDNLTPPEIDNFTAQSIVVVNEHLLIGGSQLSDPSPIYQYDYNDGELITLMEASRSGNLNDIIDLGDSTIAIAGAFNQVGDDFGINFAIRKLDGSPVERTRFDVSPIQEYYLADLLLLSNGEVLLNGKFTNIGTSSFSSSAILTPLNSVPSITRTDITAINEDTVIQLSEIFQVKDLDDSLDIRTSTSELFTIEVGEFTPAENYFGTIEFEAWAIDAFSSSDTLQITLEVTSVNDVPVIESQLSVPTVPPGEQFTLTTDLLSLTDVEGDAITIKILENEAFTLINDSTIEVGDMEEDLTFDIQAFDQESGSEIFPFDLTIAVVLSTSSFETGLLYPNPVQEEVHLKFSGIERVQVISLAGKSYLVQPSIGTTQTTFSVDHLPKGLYTVQIHLKDGLHKGLTFIKR